MLFYSSSLAAFSFNEFLAPTSCPSWSFDCLDGIFLGWFWCIYRLWSTSTESPVKKKCTYSCPLLVIQLFSVILSTTCIHSLDICINIQTICGNLTNICQNIYNLTCPPEKNPTSNSFILSFWPDTSEFNFNISLNRLKCNYVSLHACKPHIYYFLIVLFIVMHVWLSLNTYNNSIVFHGLVILC